MVVCAAFRLMNIKGSIQEHMICVYVLVSFCRTSNAEVVVVVGNLLQRSVIRTRPSHLIPQRKLILWGGGVCPSTNVVLYSIAEL
jgi:hypothetical protein